MLTVAEALAAIVEQVQPFPVEGIPLGDALGLVLAEEIVSDADSPPFDKALMDGFAVRSADVADGQATLTLVEELTAGRMPTKSVGPGEATQIMTGAPLPAGADAVVRVEDSAVESDAAGVARVRLSTGSVTPGTNIMRQGTSMKRGDRILPSGRLLRPQELGALAELGRHVVQLRRRPQIGVLATGDELVPISQQPGPGQIRNSNETMLVAQIRRAGGDPVPLGIARDERAHLGERIRAGLECDILLLSGGVSAGTLDLVPSELEAVGVRQVFHKVAMRPGKPVWFGVLNAETPADNGGKTPRCYVFGLPGNPVSSMVCFELFVRTAIRRLMGREPAVPTAVIARLATSHEMRGDRPTYYPARLEWKAAGAVVAPVNWQGSSDLRGTVEANAMALFPPGDRTYDSGEPIEVFPWD